MNTELAAKIKDYSPSEETIKLVRSVPLVLVASVAGGGKNTITEAMVHDGEFTRIVTNTTRPPRENHGVMEVDGQDYHFMNLEEAEELIANRSFVEVKKVHDNVYGSTASEFQRIHETGTTAVADIDVQGVDEYLNLKPDTKAIFLLPPSVDTWLARLSTRYGNLEDHSVELKTRFQSAYAEVKHVQQDDRYIIVINDDLETTLRRVQGVVQGTVTHNSEYADVVAEHLLEFLETKLR